MLVFFLNAWPQVECASAIVSFHVNRAQNEAAPKYVQTVLDITLPLSVRSDDRALQVLSRLEKAAG